MILSWLPDYAVMRIRHDWVPDVAHRKVAISDGGCARDSEQPVESEREREGACRELHRRSCVRIKRANSIAIEMGKA